MFDIRNLVIFNDDFKNGRLFLKCVFFFLSQELFDHVSCPKIQNCELALSGTWYVTFESEVDAMKAYKFLQEIAKNFKVSVSNCSVDLSVYTCT